MKNNYRYGDKASYKRRQLFVIMSEEVMNHAKELFDEHFKHDMLSLAADRVINVRLSLARALKNHFRTINCSFMYDPLVNQSIKVLLNDKAQDVVDLVSDITSFHPDLSDNSSQDSRGSQSADQDSTMASFMETLQRSRRTSTILEADISEMENKIMAKSGIQISKNNPLPEELKAEEERKSQTPVQTGIMEVGHEEDLVPLASSLDNARVEEEDDDAQRRMDSVFEEVLEKREEPVEEPAAATEAEETPEADTEEAAKEDTA